MGSGAVGCGAGARMERRCYPLAMTTPQLITVSEAQQMAREMANSLIADMEAKVTLLQEVTVLQEFAAAMKAELQRIRLDGTSRMALVRTLLAQGLEQLEDH